MQNTVLSVSKSSLCQVRKALPFWWWPLCRWQSESAHFLVLYFGDNSHQQLDLFILVLLCAISILISHKDKERKQQVFLFSFTSPSIQVWLMSATHLNSSSQHDSHQPHGHAQCLWFHGALCLVGQACTCSLQCCCYKVHHLPQKRDLESVERKKTNLNIFLTSYVYIFIFFYVNILIARTFNSNYYCVAGMVLRVSHAQRHLGRILTPGGHHSYPHFEMKNLRLKEVISSRPYGQ